METIFYSLEPSKLEELIQNAVSKAIEKTNKSNQQESKDRLIKISDACKLFGVSSVTIHTWKRDGLIPYYRISNKIYFKENELINSIKKIKCG